MPREADFKEKMASYDEMLQRAAAWRPPPGIDEG